MIDTSSRPETAMAQATTGQGALERLQMELRALGLILPGQDHASSARSGAATEAKAGKFPV